MPRRTICAWLQAKLSKGNAGGSPGRSRESSHPNEANGQTGDASQNPGMQGNSTDAGSPTRTKAGAVRKGHSTSATTSTIEGNSHPTDPMPRIETKPGSMPRSTTDPVLAPVSLIIQDHQSASARGDPPWHKMKHMDSFSVTRADIAKWSNTFQQHRKGWFCDRPLAEQQYPYGYLEKRVLICQLLLRVGADPTVLSLCEGPGRDNIVDAKVPLSRSDVATLIPADPEMRERFLQEQKQIFGTFEFNGNHAKFEGVLFPFRETNTSLGKGTSSTVDKVVYVHARSDGKPTTFARKKFKSGTNPEFDNEVRILRDLGRHRHVVEFMGSYEHGYDKGIILHPAADGGTLDLFLRRDRQLNPLTGYDQDSDTLQRVFGCLSVGLGFIGVHSKLRHKDIKTINILLHESHVLFTDFGSALKFSDKSGKTRSKWPGSITQRFAAPEILHGGERNVKTDMFALGCVFAEVLAVLSGHSVCDLEQHLCISEKGVRYADNVPKLTKWLREKCQGRPELQIPVDWCLAMLKDIDERPHIFDLVTDKVKTCEEQKKLDVFFCAECVKEVRKLVATKEKENDDGKQATSESRFGLTPLSYAARCGDANTVRKLLSLSADPTIPEPTEGATPMHWAVKSGSTEIVDLLFQKGAKVKEQDMFLGPALNIAAIKGDLEMAQYLVAKEAGISDKSELGRTALHQAVRSGSVKMVKYLIQIGADLSAKDSFNCSPLHLASASGNKEIVEALLDAMRARNIPTGLDDKDVTGRTPLHVAAFHGAMEVVMLLAESGASAQLTEFKFMTPADLAKESDYPEVATYLKERERKEDQREPSRPGSPSSAGPKPHTIARRVTWENKVEEIPESDKNAERSSEDEEQPYLAPQE